MSDRKECYEPDMIKKIVLGDYYKYKEQDDWFSYNGSIGSVRVIEGVLCHAVRDIEYYPEGEYDITIREQRTSRKVYRWVPYEW